MKNFAFFLIFLAFSGNVYAFNLGDTLKQIGKDSTKEVSSNFEKKLNKIVKKYENKIDKEIAGYKKKIADAEKSLDQLLGLKAKAESYLKIAKIVIWVLSSGILVLLFLMWRIWRGVVNTRRMVQNVSNYKEFDKRLKAVEKKVL